MPGAKGRSGGRRSGAGRPRYHYRIGEEARRVLQILALQRHTTLDEVIEQLILEERERVLAQTPATTGKEE